MIKLDHLVIGVRDAQASRDWYVRHLGLQQEFEVPERRAIALQDDGGLTLFVDASEPVAPSGTVLYFQVDDVDATSARLAAAGVSFGHPPQKTYWGYGAELFDPDGYRVRLWDEVTMKSR